MLDEFEVAVDDDSAYDVAEAILRIRRDCERGEFGEVVRLREEWAGRGGREVQVRVVEGDGEGEEESSEEESEEEEEEEDVEMGEAPPQRERPAPEIDEEGFQTVVSRKKR
jgi:pre-rRNA-processing protein TSR2